MPEASRQAGQERAEPAAATDPGGLQSVEVQNPQTPPSTIFGQDYEPEEEFPLQETQRNDQQPVCHRFPSRPCLFRVLTHAGCICSACGMLALTQ